MLCVVTLENLRINVRLVSNEKYYLKWTSKSSYIPQKLFDNDLVAIRRSTVRLTLNKPAYIGICILDLSKVLMCEFHYDYIKNKYGKNARLLFTDTDISCMKLKLKMSMNILITIKKCLILAIFHLKSKQYDN